MNTDLRDVRALAVVAYFFGVVLKMTRIALNIGGIRFKTQEATLQKFSTTRLARECSGNKELFYDRNPYIFSFILDSYRHGKLHLPHDICSSYLQAEIDFWEIPIDVLRPCCFNAFYGYDDAVSDIEYIGKHFPHLKLGNREEKIESEVPYKSKALMIWTLVDDAKSSRQALVSVRF